MIKNGVCPHLCCSSALAEVGTGKGMDKRETASLTPNILYFYLIWYDKIDKEKKR